METPNIYIIGITGGIGSGKSVVSRVLKLMDIPVYDCDTEAKLLYEIDEELARKMKARFGEDIYYNGKNKLNREKLARYIFSDPQALADTNAMVHPAVQAHFGAWCHERQREGYHRVGIESAILFQAGLESLVYTVWAVTAPDSLRLQRAALRDKTDVETIEARLQRQMPQDEVARRADAVINNAPTELILPQIEELIRQLPEKNYLCAE